jgi:hypothetical protein
MSGNTAWEPLRGELARWTAAGRTAAFWWRDDDAIEPTGALDTLLGLANRYDVPVTLAVVPAKTGPALSQRLANEKHAAVAVHGWAHQNHAPAEEKKQELGSHRLAEAVLGELYHGFLNLKQLHEASFVPMLVPPWNRIDDALIPKLSALGFESLSTYGQAAPDQPIGILNTHVDIMDWHGSRGGRPEEELVAELVAELQNRFEGSDEPIGLLTHHLVHDAAAWNFCDALFRETAGIKAVAWTPAASLLKT